MLHITLGGKMIDHGFHLMNCKVPYNDILGRDWTTRVGTLAVAWYQCLKFHLGDKLIKVQSNHWIAPDCSEKSYDGTELSKVEDKQIQEVQAKY